MDPRFYNVETMNKISEDEQRRPFLYRYFLRIPEMEWPHFMTMVG